ncbi:uncharacterized protein LOC134209639 [Armigeres subalbatus]|uniref:uncharacterized protein LOC134209639 n=1 Tax=Armigeres subalbatus TaxID=124917 RepID=UPI002ED36B55
MTPTERFDVTKKNALCINCLSPSHQLKNCSSGACRVCNQKHHTMLHQRTNPSSSQQAHTQSSKLSSSSGSQSSSSPSVHINHSQSSHAKQLARFWEIESCHSSSTLSLEEAACEQHFARNTVQDSTGRFIVTLPKRESEFARLGSSKVIATRRFLSLERRLNADPQLKQAYTAFINEYEQLGHMKLIDNPDPRHPAYYLPHHCVVRPDSTTTKLRVVFDASCSTDTGMSLNDALMVDPQVQDDLVSIILRFRIPQFAVISDIEKMYRQIGMNSVDQQLQLILWSDSPSETMRTYQLTTVTYGTSSAPYLATKLSPELDQKAILQPQLP